MWISIKNVRAFSMILYPPHFSKLVHIWLTLSLPSVHVDTNSEYDTDDMIFPHKSDSKYPSTPLLSYTNTTKVNRKVKYLLIKLIQDQNRESIHIYLKISYGNRKKSICFKKFIYCPVWTHRHTLLTLTNLGFCVLDDSI